MIQKIKTILDSTLFRFLVVGVINTLFGTTIMFLCHAAGLGYWLSSGANYFFGSILSFFLNKHFTFRTQEKGFKVAAKFTINIVVCWVLAYGMAQPFTLYFMEDTSVSIEMKEKVSLLVGMVLFTGLNYFGQRFFAFSSQNKNK